MLITKRQEKSIQDIAKPLENIIKSIKDASNDELPKVLRANLTWGTSKGTLLTWIDILNRFDSILESVVNKYKLGEENAKPVVLNNKDTDLVVSILDFTHMLLDNSTHKSAYSSSHRLYDLLQSPTVPVIKAVLRCFVILGKKYSIKSLKRGFVATRKVSDRIYPLALLLPASTVATSTSNEENRSLIDFIKDTAVVPKKWKNLEHTYYPEGEFKETTQPEPSSIQNSPSIKKVRSQQQQNSPIKGKKQQQKDHNQQNVTGASVYYLPETEIRKLSLEQIFDKGVERLPSKSWYKFCLKAIMGKAFNTNSYENLKLREDLVIIKILAISVLVSVNSEFEITSRIFEADPNLLNAVIELTNLQKTVPSEIRLSAAISLDCISSSKTWSTEILKNYGGSISHGLLFQNLRFMIKEIKEKDPNIDEEFNTYYLTVISNLTEIKSLAATLVSAGFIQTLSEFLHLETDYKKTAAGAAHLLNSVVSISSDYVTAFRELDGFNALISIIGYEIDFALNNPNYGGGPPTVTTVHYSISFKQANFIRSLLKFANSLIQTESGDRVRNLFDSPLLGYLNKILKNVNVFGYTLLTLAINIVSAIIHNEPTSYGILKEVTTIDLIIDNFESYFGKSSELITSLPNVIGAIALNNEGLQRVKDSDLIHKLFKIFDSNDYAKALVVDEASDYFGSTIDELARHYPDLKPVIINEVVQLIKKLPDFAKKHLPAPKIYTSSSGSFYHSKEDEVIDNEEGSTQVDAWETLDKAYIVENATVFIGNLIQYSNAWITIMDKLPFEDWLPLLTIPNSSYDYVYSNSMYPVNGILKYFDDERREYAPRILISEIRKQVLSLKDFATSTESKSIFQIYDGDVEKSDDLLKRVIAVNNILFAFVDVYCNQTTLSPTRVGQLARFFSDKEGLELLELLGQLLKRVTYEEDVIRSTLPESVSRETTPNLADEGIPPLRIVDGKEKPTPVFNKTSAKFKNSLQVRFLNNRIHGSIAVIFNTLLTLPNAGRQEIAVDSYRGFGILVASTITKILSDYLVIDTTLKPSYQLVLLDTVSYSLIDANSDKILTLPAICFMQNEGFIRQRDLLLHFWPQLSKLTQEQVKEFTEVKHTIDTPECVVLEIVTHILDLFNLITNFELLTTVSNGPLYYEGDLQGSINFPAHSLAASFLIQSKLLGFGALSGILDEDQFASIDEGEKLPPSVVSALIKLGKHLYSPSGEKNLNFSDGALYKLDWKQAKDSRNRVDYLQSLGLSEEVSFKVVNQFNGDLTLIEEESPPQGIGSSDEWKAAVEKSKEVKFNRPTPELVLSQYAGKHTLTELEESRQSKSDYLLDQFLLIAQLYPDTVPSVSDFLLSSFLGSQKHNIINFEANILRTVLEYIYSFEIGNTDSQELSSMFKLFGLLLENDTVFFGASSTMKNFTSFVIESLNPEYADRDWFPAAVSDLHRIISVSLLPKYENVEKDIAFHLPKPPQITFEMDPNLRDDLFNVLINIKELTTFKSALAVTKALLIFARDADKSKDILKSNLIQQIVKVISGAKYSDKEKPYQLESSFSLLIRSCYETKEVVQSLILREINKYFTSKNRPDSNRDKVRDLTSLVRDHSGVIIRSPELYVNELCKVARFSEFSIPLRTLSIRYHEEKDEDVAMLDADTQQEIGSEKSGTALNDQTGIVHLLLTELMTTAKKDWTTEPPLSDKEAEEQRKEKEKHELPKSPKVDVNKNENCRYILYLLKVITELLASYKKSKLEFLTFSKKQLFQNDSENEALKPRSTSLNFFLHQLIQGSVTDLTKPEDIRKRAVSELASKAIIAFVSSIDQSTLKANAKKVDPDMTFIRKFTVDSILKVVKDVTLSSQTMNVRYRKLISANKLIPSLLSTSRDKLVDENTVEFDGFHLAKTMIDANLPQALTGVLTEVDVNFPEYYFVLDSIISSLQAISKVKSKFQDLFKEYLPNTGADEEELEEDENDFKEETPDLFRNSTLGMYDVDEIDSEEDISDYDEEFDEDDADRPLAIVYSEDDDVSIDSDGDEVADSDEDEDDDSETGFGEYDMEGHDLPLNEDSESGSEGDYPSEDEDMSAGSDVELIADYEDSDGSDIESEAAIEGPDQRFNRGRGGFVDVVADSDIESELDDMVGDEDDVDELESNSGAFEQDDPGNIGSILGIGDDDDESDLDSDESGPDPVGALFANQRGSRRAVRSREPHIHSSRVIINAQDLDSLDPSSIRESIQRAATNGLTSQQMRGTIGQFESLLNRESLRRVLNPGSGANRSNDSEMTLKPTKERWNDINVLLFGKTPQSLRIIPSVVNRIFEPSEQIFNKKKGEEEERKKKEEEELKKKREEEEEIKRAEEAERRASRASGAEDEPEVELSNSGESAPIYVMIGDRQVDIAGTDIDPEFFEALPDYMREEVFTQHVRERRAQATESASGSREIDQDFLEALPDAIREEILAQEAMTARLAPAMEALSTNIERAQESALGDTTDRNVESARGRTEKQKTFFTPLVDRFGIASLVRFVFVPQSFQGRRSLYDLLGKICTNKQSRAEVLGYLVVILQDGLNDQQSLEKTFHQICLRAKNTANNLLASGPSAKPSTPRTPSTPSQLKGNNALNHFPIRATPFLVAGQVLEALQYLLESDPHLRYYFLSEHEPVILTKKSLSAKFKKESLGKHSKYPVNSLLALLDRSLVKEKSVLMDLLSRIIQITTRPLNALKKAQDEKAKSNEGTSEKQKKIIDLPSVADSSFGNVVTILTSDDCSSRTFQQTLSAMQNLLVVKSSHNVFASELSAYATKLGKVIISNLTVLVDELKAYTSKDLDAELMSKFTSSSSDQSKLLRVLTALDYLFGKLENEGDESVEELTDLYKKLTLGPLWGALSDCLYLLEENKMITHTATALLPLIEALMVVCKHSKVKELQAKDALKYENKKCDFVNEPIESLFFTFTDTHKKILNQMVRSNPKLMSGPFTMLVRNPRVLEFDNKKNYFDRKLHSNEDEKQTLAISIRRDQVFLDSYRALFFKSKDEFRNAKLDVNFKGEAGIDAGGVTREWYQVLSRQMFNPDYALFLPVASDKTTFHPNRTSWVNPEHLSFFKFIGRIIGKSIYDNCFLDCHFSRDVYKSILGRIVSLKDLETIDLEYFNSLMWMLENDITDIIIETFAVETDDYGAVQTVDLIPGGRDIAVTEENKHDYVRLVVEYRLQKSVQEQMDNFLQGFHEIIPKELISIFDEQELELLISGLPDIDVDDWKNNTTYVNYSPSSKEISYFWRAVRSFDVEERAKLLQFATGTSKVPLNGFKELGGSGDSSKFSIHKDFGSTDRLPSSHTCFNQIDLPSYDSYETLRGSLLLAITEGHEGFGLA